jgi:hypothetical protein
MRATQNRRQIVATALRAVGTYRSFNFLQLTALRRRIRLERYLMTLRDLRLKARHAAPQVNRTGE